MDTPVDELFAWLALDAARVPGRARALVQERGAAQVLAAGNLRLSGPTAKLAWDVRVVSARARQAQVFLTRGGLALGGPDGSALGRALARRRPPLFLYGRGDASLLDRPRAIAIVGTRRASPIGLARAQALAAALADADAVVVSGGAAGIDEAAHQGALRAGGATVAVLGQPVGPRGDERRRWMREAFDAASGRALSVTPYGPAVPHDPRLFAARNWTLAALADAVVVVEGAADSGTRHTAAAAQALQVPLYAWPSDVERPSSVMPNQLLAERSAHPLPADPREAACLLLGLASAPGQARGHTEQPDSPLLRALVAAGGRMTVDDAARALAISPQQVLVAAADLELDGRLARNGPALRAL